MQLCRFYLPDSGPRLGLLENSIVYDLVASNEPHFANLAALLQASTATDIKTLLRKVALATLPSYNLAQLDRPPSPKYPHLLPPIDQQEVWAAGVTYAWSREARVREAVSKDIYVRVYEAQRPELFFKATPEKVIGPHDWIGLRGDSRWNVPEPELALLINPHLQIVGYTIGNDVSSRDIEGENPLYLPQAKVYRHSCALGPAITLADPGTQELKIEMTITRTEKTMFCGQTNTARIHRTFDDLVRYLGLYNDFPCGAVLLTGTGIVPGDEFTLQDGDSVAISIETVGLLHNPARQM